MFEFHLFLVLIALYHLLLWSPVGPVTTCWFRRHRLGGRYSPILPNGKGCACERAQSCPTLCDPMDCSPPGSSVHGILQARILEWVAISFSRASSWTGDWTCISCIGRRILYCWETWEALTGKGGSDKGFAETGKLWWGSVLLSAWAYLWPEYVNLNFDILTPKRSQLKWRINWGNPFLCEWVHLILQEGFYLALRGRTEMSLGRKYSNFKQQEKKVSEL